MVISHLFGKVRMFKRFLCIVICISLLGLGGGEKPSPEQQSTKLSCEIGFIFVFPVYWSWYAAMGLAMSQQLKYISVITTLVGAAPCLDSQRLNMSISITESQNVQSWKGPLWVI